MPQKSCPPTRTWGTRFDTLPSSPPVSPTVCEVVAAEGAPPTPSRSPHPDRLPKPAQEKMPHDASVFVGSLPSTIEHQELTRLLSEHLSEHTEVKNIKVVRDSKGGVCAFVQCEDAASAATLIHTLHSNPPKPFLGRHLRYEPARAFRTLLISYRTPMQHLPVSAGDTQPPIGYHPLKMNQSVELALPFAMRLWKPRNSKFHSILYNTEAVNTETYARGEHAAGFENSSLFLQPVAFDTETIRTLAAYFGRLESIRPYESPDDLVKGEMGDSSQPWKHYPAPHDVSRGPGMDPGCWEIKWEHRDDCVSALMTLRRVPHLTVTWAHQPPAHFLEHRSQYHNGQFMPNAPSYPLHVQGRQHFVESRTDSIHNSLGRIPTQLSRMNCSGSAVVDDVPKEDDTREHSPTNQTEWSDVDFPPLTIMTGQQIRGELGAWSDKRLPEPGSGPLEAAKHKNGEFRLATQLGSNEESSDGEAQDLEVPPTPGLGRSPLTPQTPGPMFPATPTDQGNTPTFPPKEFGKEYSVVPARPERELDPTTLFVGGLEMLGPGAWDEEKVAKIFGRFGGLESVKVVRPQNSHAAFAFVKFNNTQSPARAVLEEHNHIYEGRAMRVQLRDCNPPRGYWKHNRGRGRFHSNFAPHNRLPEAVEKVQDRPRSPRSCDQGAASIGREAQKSPDLGEDGVTTGSEPPAYSEQNVLKPGEERSDVNVVQTRPSSPDLPIAPSAAPQTENYREWYDEPTTPLTPPPQSSASVLPYPVPAGYYAPPPWVHPYMPQMPYPLPYMGYPGYRPPAQPGPQSFQKAGLEMGAPVTPAPWSSIGVYGSYIPYQTPTVRTPSLEPPQSQPQNNRAPLAPTGFIQNDQGTLIAVYQPEALDQYMSGSSVATPPIPTHSVSSIPNWPQLAQSSSYHLSSTPVPSRSIIPPTPNMTWFPGPGFVSPQNLNPHMTQAPTASSNHVTAYQRGYHDASTQGSLHLKRQAPRRETSYHNQGRNNHGRPFAGRNVRGNMNHPGYHSHNDVHSGSRIPPLHQNSGEWGQWAANR